jgi:SAM-dependent methyltransferase
MQRDQDALTPLYARLLLRLVRPFPNFDMPFVEGLRTDAVRALQLKPGDRVLDLGCGIGGSLPLLADAVGPSGEVVGVEISPPTVASARRRIAANGWRHVRVVQSPAQSAPLDGLFDGLVMFAAPDVYASVSALAHVLPHLRPGARIAFFGAKTTDRLAGRLLNPLLKHTVTTLSFDTTPLPDAAPWTLVEAATGPLDIHDLFFGCMFLACGSLSPGWETNFRRVGAVYSPPVDRSSDRAERRIAALSSSAA